MRRTWVTVAALAGGLVMSGCAGPAADGRGPGNREVGVHHGPVSRVTYRDGLDDMWTDDGKRVRTVANGDVVGAEIRRTHDALVVVVRYNDIEARANEQWSASFDIDVGKNTQRHVVWGESRYADSHRWHRYREMDGVGSEDAFGAHCEGLRAGPDFKSETVTFQVPDHCFEDAGTIVVRNLEVIARAPDHAGYNFYLDNPSTSGHGPEDTPRLVEPT